MGSLQMGSSKYGARLYEGEKPQHQVGIARPFALGRAPITFADYDRFAEATGAERPGDEGWGRGDRPVINVSWDDAHSYAKWLGEMTGNSYRLPSEAEWEYAARAGTTTRYALPLPAGSDDIANRNLANCNGCGSEWDGEQTAPVGRFKANNWGLQDMQGNVWEWTEDCWHDNYVGAPDDGRAWLKENGGDCGPRVVRGGSVNDVPGFLRSASRDGDFTEYSSDDVGFRVVCSSPISDH